MATFPDLDRFVEDTTEDDTLTLPIGGREYTFRGSLLPFGRALEIQKLREESDRIFAARATGATYQPSEAFDEELKQFDEQGLYLDVIGEEMREKLIADKVPWPTVLHVGTTLVAWHMYGTENALRVWTRGRLEGDDSRPPGRRFGFVESADDIPEWIDEEEVAQAQRQSLTWGDYFERWTLIESDFHREYGVDLSTSEVRNGRSWRWFCSRLSGLSAKSLTRLSLAAREDQGSDDVDDLDRELGVRRQ